MTFYLLRPMKMYLQKVKSWIRIWIRIRNWKHNFFRKMSRIHNTALTTQKLLVLPWQCCFSFTTLFLDCWYFINACTFTSLCYNLYVKISMSCKKFLDFWSIYPFFGVTSSKVAKISKEILVTIKPKFHLQQQVKIGTSPVVISGRWV